MPLSSTILQIAFWMASAGKMLQAAKHLDVQHAPYAAGVLSFAKYMNGHVDAAEQMARQALTNGFSDPWTIHAMAHCLYAQGKALECATFLDQHRSVIQQTIQTRIY